jgi:pro-kumamolisin-like protein
MSQFRQGPTRAQEFFVVIALVGVAGPLVGCTTPTSGPSTSPGGTSTPAATMAGYVRLERGAHPLARPEFDIGPLDPDRRITNLAVVFKLSTEQQRDRDALLSAQLDSASQSYHKWLTPGEYAARFGARAADIARTRSWLTQQGLEVGATSPLGARVNFAGRVADLQTAFRTEMHAYQIGVETHYAMSSAPAIPSALSDVVLGLQNTHNFYARARAPTRNIPQAVCPDGGDCYVSGTRNFGLAPRDWATIYDVNPLYATGTAGSPLDGSGATIAIVGGAPIALGDVRAFRATYGLPELDITEVAASTDPPVPTESAADADPDAVAEAMLDTEWSGGIAPGAKIVYVFSDNVDDAAYYAIEQNIAPILSESFGRCEFDESPSEADYLGVFGSAANLLGITYLAGSGDADATGCLTRQNKASGLSGLYTVTPASFPGVTAVGGTGFPTNSLTFDCNGATGYSAAERVWNDGSDSDGIPSGGGGGISAVFSQPAYQAATCPIVGNPPALGAVADASVPSVSPARPRMRQVPDIALTADDAHYPYYIECTPVIADSGTLTGCSASGGNPVVLAVGGTSAGTPSFAGLLALVYQATGGRLGNINPLLYALNTATPQAFHDITAGSNLVACKPGIDPGCPSTCPVQGFADSCYGYQAAVGYDCASGLGSIDAAMLVRAWADVTPTTTTLAATPSTVAAGSIVSLMATVDAGGATTALGGAITFTFQSYGLTFFPANGDSYFAAFHSHALGGGPIAVTSTGTATLPATIPVGLVRSGAQYVDVSAAYGGDAHHLASTSATVRVSFTGVDLCIPQASANVLPDGQIEYSASGGAAPIAWLVDFDSTCDENDDCSVVDQATGVFTAGPVPGYVILRASDNDGAFAFSFVTAGTPGAMPPWGNQTPTSCPPGDAGAVADAEVSEDAGAADDATTSTQEAGEDATSTQDATTPAASVTEAGTPLAFTGWASTPCPLINAEGGGAAAGDAIADAPSEVPRNSMGDAPNDGPSSSPIEANNDAQSNPLSGPQTDTGAGQSSGPTDSACGCVTAGRNGSPVSGYGGIVLGLGLMARRRRVRMVSRLRSRRQCPVLEWPSESNRRIASSRPKRV